MDDYTHTSLYEIYWKIWCTINFKSCDNFNIVKKYYKMDIVWWHWNVHVVKDICRGKYKWFNASLHRCEESIIMGLNQMETFLCNFYICLISCMFCHI